MRFSVMGEGAQFPFLFGRAFIEALQFLGAAGHLHAISLPFWKGFH